MSTTSNKLNLTCIVKCCMCGLNIEPNAANMCVRCLRQNSTINDDIPQEVTIFTCRGCDRYFNPPSEWIHCELESKELLGLCLKKLKGLTNVKLIDATFIWTELHSKRIKIKLIIQKDVLGVILQKEFTVNYTINNQMCNDCHRSAAKDYWKAIVQVRQKTVNKKTFYYLEQMLLKHNAHQNALGFKKIHGGMDFFYANESNAMKFVNFVQSVLPCKYQHSKKLISHDIHSNLYKYKYTSSLDIVPLSKEDVVCLPKKLTQSLAGISPICLVYRITNVIHIIDTTTGQIAEIDSTTFYRSPFNAICNPKQLIEYIVMDIEPIMEKERKIIPGQGSLSKHHVLADVWLVKASELGIDEDTTHARTHLGHILKPGDSVLGYNIKESNINDDNFDNIGKTTIPDVILVKKHYEDKTLRKRQRLWKLKRLNDQDIQSIDGNDFEDFMNDLEDDPEMRKNINIYKAKNKSISSDNLPGDNCGVDLEEMIDELTLSESGDN